MDPLTPKQARRFPRQTLNMNAHASAASISSSSPAGPSFFPFFFLRTLWYCLDTMNRTWLPTQKRWQLNERHYGALQGLDKAETAKKYGDEQVLIWRRRYQRERGSFFLGSIMLLFLNLCPCNPFIYLFIFINKAMTRSRRRLSRLILVASAR